VNSGSTISMSATVANIGGERATETFYIGYYLSTDASWDAGDTLLTNTYTYGLNAGASVDLAQGIALPLGIGGTYYLVGKVNFNSTVPDESDLTNNTLASSAFTVNLVPPDLTVTAMTGPTGSVNSGSTISMSATVANIGGERATETFYIGYYLSTDASWDAGDTLLTNTYTYGLNAGASVDLARSVALPLEIGGTYYIVGKVNYNSTVPDESDLTNNTLASSSFTVTLSQ
jgi:hypothetical protein